MNLAGKKIKELYKGSVKEIIKDFSIDSKVLEANGKNRLTVRKENIFETYWEGKDNKNKLVNSGQYYILLVITENNREIYAITKVVMVKQEPVKIIQKTLLAPNPAKDFVKIGVRTNIQRPQITARIYTIKGELITKLKFNDSEYIIWDITNNKKEKIATGIYLVVVLAKDPDTGYTDKQIIKLAVVR